MPRASIHHWPPGHRSLLNLFVAVLWCGCTAPMSADTNEDAQRDAKLIASLKSVAVQTLDQSLPVIAFARWVQLQSGPGAEAQWEVNDCGEQTGTPGQLSQIPVCVEVDSFLKDGRKIVILIANDQPKRQAHPAWKVYFAQLITPHEGINLKRLSDLPAALIRTRQLKKDPETAK